jgi:general stress protein 26
VDKKVRDYVSGQRVCALTTLKRDGSPHAAIMHYSQTTDPFYLYFSADQTQIKIESLFDGTEHLASVAIGFSEDEWITLQMDGTVRLIMDKEDIKTIKKIHYKKISTSQVFESDPNTVFLRFTPIWWRYTDFNEDPPEIIKSD